MQKTIESNTWNIVEGNSAWIARQDADDASRRDYERERLVAWVMAGISDLMERESLSKADLARKLGCSRAHITQLLSGSRNATLHSVADLAWACGARAAFRWEPLRSGDFVSSPVVLLGNVRPLIVETELSACTNGPAADVAVAG